MPAETVGLFLPGFAARARAYAEGMPDGWETRQPPSPRATRGSLASLRDWALLELLETEGGKIVAGHSMGAALALLAAATVPERVRGLLLIAPAGLPLRKPVRESASDLVQQLARRRYPTCDALTAAGELVAAPRAAVRLVRSLRRLDLTVQMGRIREAAIPTLIVGCTTDTLVTPQHCRATARLVGGDYHELAMPGGHVWMFEHPAVLNELLRGASA